MGAKLYLVNLRSQNQKKKRKKIKTQSTFLMGFDPGFTKELIRRAVTDNYIRTKKHRKIQVVMGIENEAKKKKSKKKIIAKPTTKKKKKKKKKKQNQQKKKKKKKKK